MTARLSETPQRPSVAVSIVIFVVAVSTMAFLRLYVFPFQIITLTYGLPLLLCLWHRDVRLLWAMAAAFVAMASYKALFLTADTTTFGIAQAGMQLANTLVVAGTVHAIIFLLRHVREKNRQLEAANDELSRQGERVAKQNDELQAQSEELAQQNEELQQQGEELARQNEELERQAEELQTQGDELTKANTELTSRETLLETLFSAMRETLDEERVIRRICEALLRLLGPSATAAMVVEKSGDDMVLRMWVGSGDAPHKRWNYRSSFSSVVLERQRTAYVEDLALRPDLTFPGPSGRLFQSVLATPFTINGEYAGVLKVYAVRAQHWTEEQFRLIEWVAAQCSMALDILRLQEQLRESEHRFRMVVNALPQLVWIADPDGSVTWVNRHWQEYTGIPPERLLGAGWQTTHHPEYLPRVLECWNLAITRGASFEMEFPLRAADGGFRWYHSRMLPVKDTEGAVVRWVGTNNDVSEAREAAQAVRQARDDLAGANANLEELVRQRTARLREMNEELEHFSYSITHDMRAPLRAMQGFVGMLTEILGPDVPPEAGIYLENISRSAKRMDRLVIDSLSYSKALQQELPLTPVDVRDLLESIISSYPDLQAPKARITLESPLPQVMGNEAGLTQCFSNLLGNAVKFVEPGRVPEVRVRAERRDGMVLLWFEDNGIGIPPQAQVRLFQMFQRVSKAYEGTGIGLALVRKVAERMGGRVGVESEPGRGSRFWLQLRAAPAPASDSARSTPAASSESQPATTQP